MLRESFSSRSSPMRLALLGCACSRSTGTRTSRSAAAGEDDEFMVVTVLLLGGDGTEVGVWHGQRAYDRAVACHKGAQVVERGGGSPAREDQQGNELCSAEQFVQYPWACS